MTTETYFQKLKIKNEKELLNLLPVELWRIVDEFSDVKTHIKLRASCTSMMDWIPREKIVEFYDYRKLWDGISQGGSDELFTFREEGFQSAVHLNPQTMTQKHYGFLCKNYLYLEIFRICRLALRPPFTCSHIDISSYDDNAIQLASRFGDLSVVELLLADSRVDPAAGDNRAIRLASKKGHLSVVELLLGDHRVDPTARDNEAFKLASEKGHLSVVELLLADPRVDPAARDDRAIISASENGHLSVVELLLADPRVDPAAGDNRAIILASERGHSSVVEILLADPRVDPKK